MTERMSDALKRLLIPVLRRVYRPVMRLTRGQTLGANCALIDGEGRVLLVRHSYAPGWSFPGGGVECGETVLQALRRELAEEVGVELECEPRLHGVFANFELIPGDHVAFFVAEKWRQPAAPKRNLAIVEQRLFAPGEWPETATAATRLRLAELFEGAEISEKW
ncbi:MAG TPA: NUDIX domain-containing protein [Hyphomicrobiales bacterium]|nr:NUDIX domain-containing protein [Hyphomicrobiales bacterium]